MSALDERSSDECRCPTNPGNCGAPTASGRLFRGESFIPDLITGQGMAVVFHGKARERFKDQGQFASRKPRMTESIGGDYGMVIMICI